MTVPDFGGCPWPMDPACATEEWDAYEPEVQARALALASATLSWLVGNRVGNCPITIRPASPERCGPPLGGAPYGMYPLNWAGVWSNQICACAMPSPCEVMLPGPVGAVYEVKLDGEVVDVANYRVDGNILVWQGPDECPWPKDQNLALDDNEVGTFSVTYLNAYPVDSNGAYAVGVLALEYAKACAGDECELPRGVTTIVRQGITLQLTTGAFPNGETGLQVVDAYVAMWNPKHLRRQATVWNPNRPRPTRVTATAPITSGAPSDEIDGGSA